MIQNALKAEWTRLMSRGMLLGGAVFVGMGILVTVIVFASAGGANGPGVTVSVLSGSDGFVQSLRFTGTILGGISLVLFARTVTNEYQFSTLKVKLSQEPRRLVLLSGKFLAMALFLAAALVMTYIAMVSVASVVAGARGIDASPWWTSKGVAENLLGFLRLLAASIVWGLFGFALGTVLRSGGAAIGIGLGALLIGGHVGERFWADAERWLPDSLLGIFSAGGTASVSLAYASSVVVLYGVILGVISAFGFTRGDVPG